MTKYYVITLSQGFVVIVSFCDYHKVKRYSWHVTHSGGVGRKTGKPYARALIKGKHVYLHRFIMDPEDGQHVDHINRQTLDCRRENLRNVTPTENRRNRTK